MDRRDGDEKPRHTTGEKAGEAAGGLSGLTAGAALGSLAGPLGAMIGAVAGAVGGWWAVHAATTAHTRLTPAQEVRFRERHDRRPADAVAIPFERARIAYQLGFLAGCNHHYVEGGFAAAERELRHGWTPDIESALGPWEVNRDLVREGFECAPETTDAPAEVSPPPAPGVEPLHADPATEAANRVHDRVAERRRPSDGGR
jgi:hypothetical protein